MRAVVPESQLDLKLTTPRELGGAGGDHGLGRRGALAGPGEPRRPSRASRSR